MQPFDLILLALATFYLSHAISKTDGPGHLFTQLRANISLGGLMACFVCLSIWLAAILILVQSSPLHILIYPLAAAGLALFMWFWSGGPHV